MGFYLIRQRLDVVLRAADMVAGVGIPRLGQRRQSEDGGVLDRHDLPRAPCHLLLQKACFIPQKIGAGLEFQMCFHPRQHDGRADGLDNVIHRPEP